MSEYLSNNMDCSVEYVPSSLLAPMEESGHQQSIADPLLRTF